MVSNLVCGLALHEFSVAQVNRAPTGVWEIIGSNPVGDSDFFSLSHARDMLIISFSQFVSSFLLKQLSYQYNRKFSKY